MGYWDIIIPEQSDVINYFRNPSTELTTLDWATASGGSVSVSADQRYFGVRSAKIVADPAQAFSGAYQSSPAGIGKVGGSLTLQAKVYVSTGHTYIYGKIYYTDASAEDLLGAKVLSASAAWQDWSWTAALNPAKTLDYIIIAVRTDTANASTFYVDGLVGTLTDHRTTYIDGDQLGCSWNGAAHASASILADRVRDGGKIVNFDNYGFLVQEWNGVGMPSLDNVIARYGLIDGGFYQRTKAEPRAFTLTGTLNTGGGVSLGSLFANRKGLIDAVKPDAALTQGPFWLRFTGGSARPLYIQALYQDGLRMSYSSKSGLTEMAGLAFISPDPYFYEEGNQAALLGYQQTIARANDILLRGSDGTWQALGGGMDGGAVNALAWGPDGSLYAGGNFVVAGYLTAGSVTANRIARWNGSAWSALGTGMNLQVRALAFDAAGNLYAAGNFTTAGGVTVNSIARWDGSAWSGLGGGLNGSAYALAFGPDGSLYVGGYFTTAGSGAGSVAASKIAKWDGSAWSALGTGIGSTVGSVPAYVSAIAVSPTRSVYVGGYFTTAGGVTANCMAVYTSPVFDPSAWQAVGGGFRAPGSSDSVAALLLGADGSLYAAGAFGTAADPARTLYAARYYGGVWQRMDGLLPTGSGAYGLALAQEAGGLLYIGGTLIVSVGATTLDGLAEWNGSAWYPLDVDLPGTVQVAAMALSGNELAVGYLSSGSAVSAVVTASSVSTAAASPIFRFTGPGAVWKIVNYTTGKTIYFDLFLQAGEVAVLDLTPGGVSFSSNWRPNLMNTLSPGSTLSNFKLAPGPNNISVFIYGTTSAATEIAMLWRGTYWSIDGSV